MTVTRRDDERRKFEALIDEYAEAAYNDAVIGEQYTETEQLSVSSNLVAAAKLAVMKTLDGILARAEQAETPRAARKIDGKFSTDGVRIFNTVSGEVIPEDEPPA